AFLHQLARERRLNRFAGLDAAPGQVPSRHVAVPDQEDAAILIERGAAHAEGHPPSQAGILQEQADGEAHWLSRRATREGPKAGGGATDRRHSYRLSRYSLTQECAMRHRGFTHRNCSAKPAACSGWRIYPTPISVLCRGSDWATWLPSGPLATSIGAAIA